MDKHAGHFVATHTTTLADRNPFWIHDTKVQGACWVGIEVLLLDDRA
jgi:hypothetical protein